MKTLPVIFLICFSFYSAEAQTKNINLLERIPLSKLIELKEMPIGKVDAYLRSKRFQEKKDNKYDEGEGTYSWNYSIKEKKGDNVVAAVLFFYDKSNMFYDFSFRFHDSKFYNDYLSDLAKLHFVKKNSFNEKGGEINEWYWDDKGIYLVTIKIQKYKVDNKIEALYTLDIVTQEYMDKRIIEAGKKIYKK